DETGLYDYGYRYYAPWLGRWLNPDPAGTVDGLNLYRMVRNNPGILRDIDGLSPKASRKSKVVTKSGDESQPSIQAGGGGSGSNISAGYFKSFFRNMFLPRKYKDALERLSGIVEMAKSISGVDAKIGDAEYISSQVKLISESNAENFHRIVDYIEAGHGPINYRLRGEVNSDELLEFKHEFSQLNDYHGLSFRSAYVTDSGADLLLEGRGEVFLDRGVQSASTQLCNALEWAETWSAESKEISAKRKILYVFDESFSMKNLASGEFADHVAMPPGNPMKLMATKEEGGMLYVYMSAPTKMPRRIYNVYSGESIPF
ncbi:RHS repeat-associated core domain-containing protein, partial [Chromobacterium violaceum]